MIQGVISGHGVNDGHSIAGPEAGGPFVAVPAVPAPHPPLHSQSLVTLPILAPKAPKTIGSRY